MELDETFELLATCQDGDVLLEKIEEYQPNIVLIDISMPGASIETVISKVDKSCPDVQLIALTMHLEAFLAKKLLNLGLSGYVSKDAAFEELITAVRHVFMGEVFISPVMIDILFEYDKQQSGKPELTKREVEVLQNAGLGQSNKEIARTMNISERTVRFHLSNSCIKLKANGRANAVALALQSFIIHY